MTLNGQLFESITKLVYLGIKLGNHLAFEPYVDYAVDKAMINLVLHYTKQGLQSAGMSYSIVATPHFDTANTLYCTVSVTSSVPTSDSECGSVLNSTCQAMLFNVRIA